MGEERAPGTPCTAGVGCWLPLAPRWPRLAPGRSLVWPLPAACFAALPATLELDGMVLLRKREFHTTLLDAATTTLLREALHGMPARSAARWRAGALALDWRWRPLPDAWLVHRVNSGKPEAWSVVGRIEQPAQATFRTQVATLVGRPLPAPLPHVTLHTASDHGGIGLPDEATFRARRVRPVAVPGWPPPA